MISNEELVEMAIQNMKNSYSPYSGFCVGAAVLADNGKVYGGCNIENVSFTPTVCAERVAIFSAVREGVRKFKKIAVVGGMHGNITSFTYPCGVCRQVMREFCEDDFVLLVYDGEQISEHTLAEILPHSFAPRAFD